jgi:hypothetical protein
VSQGVPDVFAGQRFVVVAAPDEFTAERPELVAMAACGCLDRAPIQQVRQERCEHFNDLLTHGDIRRIDVPGSRSVIEVRAGLAQAPHMLRIQAECVCNPPKRHAQCDAGRPPRGQDPESPQTGSKAGD